MLGRRSNSRTLEIATAGNTAQAGRGENPLISPFQSPSSAKPIGRHRWQECLGNGACPEVTTFPDC